MWTILLVLLVAYADLPPPRPASPMPPPTFVAPEAAWTLRMLDLPITARDLRSAGVPETDVDTALDAARSKGLSAGEAEELLEESSAAVKAYGPVANFGAYVQRQLDAGLRGRELAAAIHGEHQQRGEKRGGNGKTEDAEHGKGGDHGQSGDHGKGGEHGKSDGASGRSGGGELGASGEGGTRGEGDDGKGRGRSGKDNHGGGREKEDK